MGVQLAGFLAGLPGACLDDFERSYTGEGTLLILLVAGELQRAVDDVLEQGPMRFLWRP